jgi:hypothetical protein
MGSNCGGCAFAEDDGELYFEKLVSYSNTLLISHRDKVQLSKTQTKEVGLNTRWPQEANTRSLQTFMAKVDPL